MKRLLLIMLTFVTFASAQEIDTTKGSTTINPIEQAFNSAKIVICFDDIPRSFWKNQNNYGTMFLNCFLLDGSNTLTRKVIKEMRVYDPYGSNWVITPDVFKLRIGNWGNFYSTKYSFDGSVLPLGEYIIEIIDTDGLVYRREIELSDFSGNITSNSSFIYSSDYTGKTRHGYIKSIDRPIITRFQVNNDNVILDFKINDLRVKNAGISFYDESKKYIGSYEFFYNAFSDQIRKEVNNGDVLFIDGSINKIILNSRNIRFEEN